VSTSPEPTERVRLWRPAGLAGVEVLHAERSARLWRWYHEAYAFCAVLRGGGNETRYRRHRFQNVAGVVAVMEPGELHADERYLGAADFRVAFVAPALLVDAGKALGARGEVHFPAVGVRDRASLAAALRFHRSLADGSPPLAQQALLAEYLVLRLTRGAEHRPTGKPAPDAPAVARARAYLHAHWAEEVGLDDLAAAASASKWHLVRQFKEGVGLPPHAYLVQLRLAKAKDLIAAGRPIAEAAAEAGFAAQSHLHRHFVRAYGITPGQYAKGART